MQLAAILIAFGIQPVHAKTLVAPVLPDFCDPSVLKSLTDERVRMGKTPFYHPSLTIPNGHVGNEVTVQFNATTNQAMQESIELPTVGAAGRGTKGLPGLQTFDSGLQ